MSWNAKLMRNDMGTFGTKKPLNPLAPSKEPHGFMIEPPKVVGLGKLCNSEGVILF